MVADLEVGVQDDVKLSFGWKNISYSVDTKTGKKDILRNVSGFVQSGTISF